MPAFSPWTWLPALDAALVVIGGIMILRRPREPRAMLAWLLALLLLPLAGMVLFLLMGEPRIRRHHRRRRKRRRRLDPHLAQKSEKRRRAHAAHESEHLDPPTRRLMHVATHVSGFPPTRGNQVTIYQGEHEVFEALKASIESARHHVHLEYYILQPDATGHAVRDLLIAKARAGVACRVLLDYVGCWRLGPGFYGPMRDAGVKVEFFMPVIPWRGRWRVNFRNHRKIAVIDGALGFTGSQNIGDEYRGRLTKYGPWRDTQIELRGPGVTQLQEVFTEDWHDAAGEGLIGDAYFPEPASSGGNVVQLIPTGPVPYPSGLHALLLTLVGSAQQRVSVVTPYFVPDTAMVLAFQTAAMRGVHVRLMIPSRCEHRVVLWAGRSFYRDLAAAGVEIYEYDHAMLHSKAVAVDGRWAMVGSANMDERSFRINFELTAMLYDDALTAELERDFEQLRARARRIHADDAQAVSFLDSLKLGLARAASPLL